MLDLNNCVGASVDHSYISWYVKLDWNQREMQKENIFQTIFHLNTKSVDCVRTTVDVVWPCSLVEAQKAREKWSYAYV